MKLAENPVVIGLEHGFCRTSLLCTVPVLLHMYCMYSTVALLVGYVYIKLQEARKVITLGLHVLQEYTKLQRRW